MKTNAAIKYFAVAAGFSILSVFSAYGEDQGLNQAEFAEICAEFHADKSRSFRPPLKDPEAEAKQMNYEYHYRQVLLQPDGSVIDNPYDTSRVLLLNEADLLMDMADGYELRYEYHIRDTGHPSEEMTVVDGAAITPYYRAVLSDDADPNDEKNYQYFANHPEELPVIPDFPQNYDWKSHGDTTLEVTAYVTVHSTKDGRETSFESNIAYVTNLSKDVPDCYLLRPTDQSAYTVQKGDSLYKIAKKLYGNGDSWTVIFERNREWIPDADLVYPGMLLVIPAGNNH